MGYLKEKYNRGYFLGVDSSGRPLGCGVEGVEAFQRGDIRERDKALLRRLEFHGARVLELGFGRGEALKFAHDAGADSLVGLDFAQPAFEIASDHLKRHGVAADLYCGDALEILREKRAEIVGNGSFDIVLMLDFVEHVPRVELAEVLGIIRGMMSAHGVLAISTPIYRFDNDAISQGFNENASDEELDGSDFRDATRGMHCNKFSEESLPAFLASAGFESVSLRDLYIKGNGRCRGLVRDFATTWGALKAAGYPLAGLWRPDELEYSFRRAISPAWDRVESGPLEGAEVFVAKTNPSHRAFLAGTFETLLLSLASQADLKAKSALDIGAHIGLVSLHLAALVAEGGCVVAFEPNPVNLRRLRLNLSKNRALAEKILIAPVAISGARALVEFTASDQVDNGYSSAGFVEGAHTTLPPEQFIEKGFFNVKAQAITLDEFFEENPEIPPPGLIKVDVEGAEHLVLSGGNGVLTRYRPMVLIEIHSPYCMERCLSILKQVGYCSRVVKVETDGRCILVAEYDWVGRSYETAAQEIERAVTSLTSHDQSEAALERKKLLSILIESRDRVAIESRQARNQIERMKEEAAKISASYAKSSEQSDLRYRQLEAANANLRDKVDALSRALDAKQSEVERLVGSRRYRLGSLIVGPLSFVKKGILERGSSRI